MANGLPILVIAGDYRQFTFWCRERDIDPRTNRRAVFIGEGDVVPRIQGRRGNPYVMTGTYYERRDLSVVRQYLYIIGAVPYEEVKTDG